jgi:hypothetical protein
MFITISRKRERETNFVEELIYANIANSKIVMDQVVYVLLYKSKAIIWKYMKSEIEELVFKWKSRNFSLNSFLKN